MSRTDGTWEHLSTWRSTEHEGPCHQCHQTLCPVGLQANQTTRSRLAGARGPWTMSVRTRLDYSVPERCPPQLAEEHPSTIHGGRKKFAAWDEPLHVGASDG